MDMMSLRRRVLVNQNKLVSASGNPLTFNTPLTKPLKECVVRFTPKQSGSGTPSPENVREIVGKNGITVYQQGDDGVTHETSVSFPAVGKNLFDDREENVTAVSWSLSFPNPFTEAGTYTISAQNEIVAGSTTGSLVCIGDSESGANSKGLTTWTFGKTTSPTATFTIIDNDLNRKYLTFRFNAKPNYASVGDALVQIEKGSTASDYEPFDNTIYGGYVDLVNGEVVAEWKKVDMGEQNWAFTWNTFNTAPSDHANNNVSGTPTNIMCDIYPSDVNAPATMVGSINKNIRGRSSYKHICIRDDDYTTATDFKTAVTGHYLAYKLAEPIHYPIPTHILTTLKGQNVMWSDANGDLTVRYWTR